MKQSVNGTSIVLGDDTRIVLFIAGLIFLLALGLGIWKYVGMATSETHLAHPYVDIAHRAALLYSFATLLVAALVEFSAWSQTVNLVCAGVLIFFFLGALTGYIAHGITKDTDNGFRDVVPGTHVFMVMLILGEMGAISVLLVGFAKAQF